MALFDFRGYDNEVLAEQIKSILDTKLDINRFMTADDSLAEAPGMVKKIHKYIGTGTVEDLARGEGNTEFVDAEFIEEEYRVGRTQGTARWYDEDAMTDPTLIDAKLQYLSEGMVNSWTEKAIKEFDKSLHISEVEDYSLASFADTIGKYSEEHESEEGLFFLCNIKLVPELRKMLGDYLKYTEGYIKTGAVGDILGVPVYTSKAVPEGIIYLATNKAVTAFVKKDIEVEDDRDKQTKRNSVIADRWAVIALTDDSQCVVMGKAQETAATITSATGTTVAGAATTGATVQVYVNGKASGVAVVAASDAYSATIEESLVSGDVVMVVARLAGKVASIASTTVA